MGYGWEEFIHRNINFGRFKIIEKITKFITYVFIKIFLIKYTLTKNLVYVTIKPRKTKSVGNYIF
jgi:hypothetical protein